MDVPRKLSVTLFDSAMRRVGWVPDFLSCTVTERHNGQSFGDITVQADHPALPKMLAPGAQVQVYIDRRFDVSTPEVFQQTHRLIAGRLRNPRGSLTASGSVTFQIEGHWRLFRNFVTWVNPGEALEASSLTDRAQSWDGPSGGGTPPPSGEDGGRWGYLALDTGGDLTPFGIVNAIIDSTVNTRWAARFGVPAIETGFGFAADPTPELIPQMRFGTVEDYIVPILNATGFGLRPVIQEDPYTRVNRLQATYYEPRVWSKTLTPDSGTVTGGEWSIQDASLTDIVVGGPGDLSARAFLGASDPATSLAMNDMIEGFRDATGAPLVWPDGLDEKYKIAKYYLLRPDVDADRKAAFLNFLEDAGAKALAEGSATSGVSVELSESEGFRFTGTDGDGYSPPGFATGDVVTIAPSQETALEGLTFTSRITQTTVTQSRDNGFTVTPQVGERKDDPDVQLALAVRGVALANARRSTSK